MNTIITPYYILKKEVSVKLEQFDFSYLFEKIQNNENFILADINDTIEKISNTQLFCCSKNILLSNFFAEIPYFMKTIREGYPDKNIMSFSEYCFITKQLNDKNTIIEIYDSINIIDILEIDNDFILSSKVEIRFVNNIDSICHETKKLLKQENLDYGCYLDCSRFTEKFKDLYRYEYEYTSYINYLNLKAIDEGIEDNDILVSSLIENISNTIIHCNSKDNILLYTNFMYFPLFKEYTAENINFYMSLDIALEEPPKIVEKEVVRKWVNHGNDILKYNFDYKLMLHITSGDIQLKVDEIKNPEKAITVNFRNLEISHKIGKLNLLTCGFGFSTNGKSTLQVKLTNKRNNKTFFKNFI